VSHQNTSQLQKRECDRSGTRRKMTSKWLHENEALFKAKRGRVVLVSGSSSPRVTAVADPTRTISRKAPMRSRRTTLVSEPSVQIPVSTFDAARLRQIMELLVQTASHEVTTTKDLPEEEVDVDPPSEQGQIVVFDSEKAVCLGKKTYKGPYLAMKEVVAMLLGVSNKSTLSIACVPNQCAIVRAAFSYQSPLQIAKSDPKRLSDLDKLLFEAAELAKALLAQMLEGWKQNLVQLSETNATKHTTQPLSTIDDLWNWNPSKLTYRAFSVKDGEHVPSYVQDFLGAFMVRKKGMTGGYTTKENPLSDHPFVKDMVSKLLAKRDGAVKKGAATISKGEKRHRHPCIGPLEIEDYRLHELTIVAASGGCQASRVELEALFPGQLAAVLAQHEFEVRFVRLCDLIRDALFLYTSNTEGNIFGDDHVGLRGIWCLTSRQYYKGGLVESTNTKETWYLNFLNRIMAWDDQSLKGRLYQPHDDSNTTVDQRRRHSTTKTMDAVFLQISARVNGWVECELMSKLLPFYLDRIRAFQHSQLLPAMKRDEMCKLVGVCRNTLDSFDDLLTPRVILTDKAPPELTSWKTPGSVTEQLNIDQDALILSIVVLGREEAKRLHGDELLEHGIDLSYQENEGSSGCSSIQLVDTEPLGCMSEDNQNCKTIDERIAKAEDAMSEWISIRQRCDVKTLLARIAVMRKKLQDAVENAVHATRATELVREAYHRVKAAQKHERDRISAMDTDMDLTVDERCTLLKEPDREQAEALSAAIDEAFKEISTGNGSWFYTFKESIAMTVGQPPYFNWGTTDGSEETAVPQSRHVAMLKRMNSLLELYKTATESNTSATAFIDMVSPMEDYVGMMTNGRFSAGKGEEGGDWVGFKDGGGSLKMNKRVVDWLETRISTMISCPTQFLDTIANVSYSGFLRALSWAGVFSEHNSKVPLAQKPHLGLSVVFLLKVLAVAAVNDALYFSTSDADHADAVSGTQPSALFVVGSESKRIDMVDTSSIKAFAKTSTDSWRCVCAIASFTETLLTYNRDVKFNSDCWEAEWAKCVDFVPLSFCTESFLVLHEEQLDEFKADKNSFLASMCKNVGDYPTSTLWSFSDSRFTAPGAFRVLLTWLPRSVHYKHGFFQMSGVRERPDFENGFLNVKDTLPSNATAEATQFWDGFCTHPIASTHGRLPTPPPSAASAAGSSEMHSAMQLK